ncbi:MAG: UDP-glucose 4-epimerase GalE [Candidatus Dormibacteria bacterium]
MRLVVVGGAGYIGSVVATRLLEAGHEVVVLDDLSTGHLDAVPPGALFVQGSVAAAGQLERLLAGRVDAVLHFAARSLVGESAAQPELYWGNNVCGTQTLLQAMRAAGVSRLVFSSSSATYGQPDSVPITEEAPTRPTSPYGNTKRAADLMIGDQARAHGLRAVSLRYFNAAGAVGKAGERHHPETHLIPNLLEVAAGRAEAIRVFGSDYPTPDGTCVRDYIHVDDLASAHLLALEATAPTAGTGWHRIYNLGNGNGFSVREVIESARRVTASPIPVLEAARRPGDPAVLVASSQRIREELGWLPARPGIDEMIADAWEFARSGSAS